jgi:hypothetical protein
MLIAVQSRREVVAVCVFLQIRARFAALDFNNYTLGLS